MVAKLRTGAFVALLFYLPLSVTAAEDEERRLWHKITDKNGIQVYRSHSEESRLKSFKGETIIEMDDLFVFLAAMRDFETMQLWMHQVSKLQMIGPDSETRRKVYVEVLMPWPIKDREVYADIEYVQLEDYTIEMRVGASENPPPPNEGFILIRDFKGYISAKPIEGTNQVKITYQMLVDPGGYAPAWVVNLVTADVPFFTLKKMGIVFQREEYQNSQYASFKRRPWLNADANEGANE